MPTSLGSLAFAVGSVASCGKSAAPPNETVGSANAGISARSVGAGVDVEKAPLLAGMGTLHWPISIQNATAQRLFDQGVVLAYAFNHAEAARSFRYAAKLDPKCARRSPDPC